ncbi:uncharacterized protein LOC122813656 isoform X2 [Protopterus annectens]|uniref:uncharacterized protein LOC122813656 isoform X2 n=1 Tax=Protopterus annectens TaxID=7888 RepID=UPI001CFB9483|nr:uncharacterized protein LOC122813656 isoform X2 [Protopterus annectens]
MVIFSSFINSQALIRKLPGYSKRNNKPSCATADKLKEEKHSALCDEDEIRKHQLVERNPTNCIRRNASKSFPFRIQPGQTLLFRRVQSLQHPLHFAICPTFLLKEIEDTSYRTPEKRRPSLKIERIYS